MVKAGGERLVISYQRPGDAQPQVVTVDRPRHNPFLILQDPENATRRDMRTIGQALAKTIPNLEGHDVKVGKNGLTVSRVLSSGEVAELRMWDDHAGDDFQKAKNKKRRQKDAELRKEKKAKAKLNEKNNKKSAKEAKKKNKKEARNTRRLEKKAAASIKEQIYALDTAYIPFTPPWKKKRDIRKVVDTSAGALAIGRLQENRSYKRRKKADPQQQGLRGFEWGRWRSNFMAGLPVVGLRSDAKVAKGLVSNLLRHESNVEVYNGTLAQVMNGILDPMNEIHGVASSISEVVTEMQRGAVGFLARNFLDKHPLVQDFSELAIIAEKATSPDPKGALAKLVAYSIVRNKLTGHHDEKSAIGRFLMKIEEKSEMKPDTHAHQPNQSEARQELTIKQKKAQERKERYQKFLDAFLPQPSVLEEAYDRKVDRQNMVAVALTYLVLNPNLTAAEITESNNPAYQTFKVSLAGDFIKSMDAKPDNLHIFARRAVDFVDRRISAVEKTIEANIPGGNEVAKILLGKTHDIKDPTLAAQYKADGQELLKLYDNGGTKQQFIQLTAQFAKKYITNKNLPGYQKELWRQAAEYAQVVEDTYQAAQKLAA